MVKRVAPLKLRKVKKEGMESGSSSDSGTWIPEGEGFGYPSNIFTDPIYSQTSEREELTEVHPTTRLTTMLPPMTDSANESMPREEVGFPNKIKFDLGLYCPSCTLTGYRCICNDEESDWDGTVETYHPLPQAEIKQSWLLHEETKKTPHCSIKSNSPKPEKAHTPLECMESDWDADLEKVPDYLPDHAMITGSLGLWRGTTRSSETPHKGGPNVKVKLHAMH